MNLMSLMQLKSAWNDFKMNHPKFPRFLDTVSKNALHKGTVIEFHVTAEDGKSYSANLKLTQADMESIQKIKEALQEIQ